MKICPNCHAQIDENVPFCPNCGAPQGTGRPYAAAPAFDPTDHTSEFDPRDISENKVVAMLPYLLDILGLIVAAMLAGSSAYVSFHIRQSLKLTVCTSLLGIAALLLAWTIIVPIIAAIASVILFVIRIICFVQICKGQAKEPAIVKNFSFLK